MPNQKMIQYNKIIAIRVGIKKYLTTHIGRKIAETYLLNNNIPIITVSEILGHKTVKATEKIYVHFLEETIVGHTVHLV